MVLLRASLFEARMLLRVAGIPASIVVVVLAVVLHVEEPHFVQVFNLQFFWQSLEAGVALIIAQVPLAWVLSRRAQAWTWTSRLSRHALLPVLAAWLGILGVMLMTTAVAAVAAVLVRWNTVESNDAVFALVLRSCCFGAPLAALAPGLSMFSLTPSRSVFLWSIVMALSLGVVGLGIPIPLDRILGIGDVASAIEPSIVLAACLSTAAGLLLSWAAYERNTSSH